MRIKSSAGVMTLYLLFLLIPILKLMDPKNPGGALAVPTALILLPRLTASQDWPVRA